MCPVRVWNRRKEEEEVSDVPVLLPHELIAAFRSECLTLDHLLSRRDMDTKTGTHLESTSTSLGLDGNVIGLRIWLDGVCCKWDRSSSIEMITLLLRVPVACIVRGWMMKALRNRDWKRNAPSPFHLCRYCGAFKFQTRLRNATHSTTCLLWWLGLCGAQQWGGGQAQGTTTARFG